ncbi:hypothetical protein ACIA03_08685 [Nocardioides sp. NPDC051685]|uniref:hypothetical protein n=1 Tax=Nocardioides sp. NPDC051685 TaxID=3364334 RepID=UPI003790ADDD
MSQTVECTRVTRAGRRAKARQFLDQAENVLEVARDPADVADDGKEGAATVSSER